MMTTVTMPVYNKTKGSVSISNNCITVLLIISMMVHGSVLIGM